MSYTLLGATARLKSLDAAWEPVDVSAMTFQEILDTYQNVYLELSHFAYAHSIYLNLKLVRDGFNAAILQMTPQVWLTSIGNLTLPIVEQLPNPRELWVRYEDAFKAGYNVDLINIGRHLDSQLPHDDKNDLWITKSTINFDQMWRYFLVSVNGLIHRSMLGPNGLYVIDGGRTKRLANENICGLMSFREVGKMEMIPITPEMISAPRNNQPLHGGFFLSLPKPVEGKTVLLSVGGYLHLLDDSYSIAGDQLLKINFSRFNHVDRYYQSYKRINLDTLPLTKSSQNPDQVLTESFFSDQTVRAYMSLPQSFVILLDCQDIYLRRHRLDNTKLPGVYQHEIPAKRLPMFSTYGRLLDHVSYIEDEKVVYNADYATEPNLLYRTMEWRSSLTVDPQCYPARPWWFADAELVEFGRFQ